MTFSSGPLQGIRVVEQGTFITGPCCGMMLADLGADVIKIETPGSGDPYRAYQTGIYSAHFQAYNRNKRSLTLDLKSPADQQLRDHLVAEADVFIQNFRPGAAERLGAGHARLTAMNPRLVYTSISGFGATGPYAGRPTYDSVAQALSGFLSVVTDPDQPRFLGPALADAITGIYAAYGTLGALVARGRTGKGAHVEVSMMEAMAHFAIEPFTALFALGKAPAPNDRPRLAQAHILRTADDRLVVIHLSSLDKFWDELTAALDAQHLRDDPRFATRLARVAHFDALHAALEAITLTRSRAAWVAIMDARDVPFAAVNSIAEAAQDPQAQALGLIVPLLQDGTDAASHTVRPAISIDGRPEMSVAPAPRLDADGPAIRAALQADNAWPGRPDTPKRNAA
ncbi:MAG: CoA transferase [Rhodobacteraceae bacterium]|jgi:crotonobetainyl-CoA:carnitine CoA-transferase CaiB-like acyl-CoA transferase|nr:CoA transferase [Paracoccaceae bacterium]